MEHSTRVDSNGVSLFVRTWGSPKRPPMVLVHGYPDNHRVWQEVAERLASRFYVIAYDVRGAGLSDAPEKLAGYRLPRLAADLKAVVDALVPGQRFHLVGHDWGSIQSWESVTTEPLASRILSFTSISGPCLDHVGHLLRRKAASLNWQDKVSLARQLGSSWYIFFFQVPMLAPALWRRVLAENWPGYLAKTEAVEEPEPNPTQATDGSRGVMLYRANILQKLARPQLRYAHCPVQLIEPLQDRYVGTTLAEQLERWVPLLTRRTIDAGHWVLLKDPDTLAGWLGDFAAAHRDRAS